MGYDMKGFSGFGNSPMKKESSEFEKAFASARKEQGAGGEFEFKGKKYSTARKDDPSVAGQFISKDLKDVDTGEQYKDPHGHIKRHKSGDVEDLDYTVHKGTITGHIDYSKK